ncbi:hypothetical protein OK016_19895 [Vibrio chagasii]|nr:hypothetical protein [Vibrio chagasii]
MSCIFISALISRRISTRFSQMEQRIADDFSRTKAAAFDYSIWQTRLVDGTPNRSELELQVEAVPLLNSKL